MQRCSVLDDANWAMNFNMLVREDLQDWMRLVLKETGWSSNHWAELAGTSSTNITRFLNDPSASFPTIPTLAKLMLPLHDHEEYRYLLGRLVVQIKVPPDVPALATMPIDLPVRGTAVGGDDEFFDFNGQIVDYVRRPPGLATATDAFAIYVAGDSMSPRFNAGDLVFVHPGRPAQPGSDVLVELFGSEEGPGHCYIKRLVRRTAEKIILAQYNPRRDDINIPTKKVRAIYRILTAAELLGV